MNLRTLRRQAPARASRVSWRSSDRLIPPIVPDMAPYATDGSIFRGAGIPTYGVSSLFMKQSDEFAHGLNERVPVAAFYAGLDHWYVLLTTLAGTK